MFESILCQVTAYDPEILEPLIELAVEIAREGREGRRIGTLFTFGDAETVLAKSRSLILDPLTGHPESSRSVTDLNLRGTIKELVRSWTAPSWLTAREYFLPPAVISMPWPLQWRFRLALAAATLPLRI